MLTTDLAKWPALRVVSRSALGEILREQWLQHRGTADSRTAVTIGRLIGVRYLAKGHVFVVGNRLHLEAHLIDVERGTVVHTVEAAGPVRAIPDLEERLARQIIAAFPLAHPPDQPDQGNRPRPPESTAKTSGKGQTEYPSEDRPWELPSTHASGIDALLTLEQNTTIRQEAWSVADKIWLRGLTVSLGKVKFQGMEGVQDDAPIQMVSVPVAGYFTFEGLAHLHRGLQFTVHASRIGLGKVEGVLKWTDGEGPAHRMFEQNLQTPRRVFVRTISETGQVTAISSLWSWKVGTDEEHLQGGMVRVPLWPDLVVQGEVQFPALGLMSAGTDVRFDAVVVPIPGEARFVRVEMVEHPPSEGADRKGQEPPSAFLREAFREWILEHWAPPVWESVPVGDYLPGNRRTARLLVRFERGRVSQIDLLDVAKEIVFSRSVRQLAASLSGRCFLPSCPADRGSQAPGSASGFEMRIQLDLLKDIRQVGLGSHLRGWGTPRGNQARQ